MENPNRRNRLQKFFGVGPLGAAISLLLFALFSWINQMMGHPTLSTHTAILKILGMLLFALGLGLHSWAFWTLRHWWADDRLCTMGPFRYFRHPMYAAWVTCISSGVALYLNSWVYLLWAVLLHPIWHWLVKKEEIAMTDTFGDDYRDYARRTGRFIPRVFNRDY